MEMPKQEVCKITIIFPVKSDEDALNIKKKMKDLLADNPDALFNFNIGSMILPSAGGAPNGGLGR